MPTYKRQPIVFTHGRGCYVYDSRDKKYLDFLGGIAVNALGHAHPRIVKVIREQAALLIHSSNLYYHEFQGPLAKKLAEEAIEVVIDAVNGDAKAVVRESADLLYNLVVLWVASGVDPKDVWKEMNRRERLFGIAEKMLKPSASEKMRPRLAAMSMRRLRKSR